MTNNNDYDNTNEYTEATLEMLRKDEKEDEEIENLWILDKDSDWFLCGGIPSDPSGGNFTHFGPFRDREGADGIYDEIVRAQAAWTENDYEEERTHWVIQADREADKLVLETVGGLLDD